jgi:DNA-binding CsgD family transcriptional regulator
VWEVLGAEQVELFRYDATIASLVASGGSATPLGQRLVDLGLDRLPLINGGLAVTVFQTGQSIVTGHAAGDRREVPGFISGLGLRSELICLVEGAGQRHGVLLVGSTAEDGFLPVLDLCFVECVAAWLGEQLRLPQPSEAGTRPGGRLPAAGEQLLLLTPRQREIAELVAEGLTNAQIGARLSLTTGTVANYIANILDRLDCTHRTQIATFVAGAGRARGDLLQHVPQPPGQPERPNHRPPSAPGEPPDRGANGDATGAPSGRSPSGVRSTWERRAEHAVPLLARDDARRSRTHLDRMTTPRPQRPGPKRLTVACPVCGRPLDVSVGEVSQERIARCPDGHPLQLRDLSPAGQHPMRVSSPKSRR